MVTLFVEPEWRAYRVEESVPLERLCKRIADCLCVRPGPISLEVLEALRVRGYDQAPAYDPTSHTCWGLVTTPHLRRLCDEGLNLESDDPQVSDPNKEFRVGSNTNIYQLLHKLRTERAVIVIQESDASEYGHMESCLGLFTFSDLNRHEIRRVLYSLFSDVEAGLANLVQRWIRESWDWIKILGENQQVRILGYWELAKRRDVDIGPLAAVSLSNLLAVVRTSRGILAELGFESERAFREFTDSLPEFRNRIMHVVRPLVLDHDVVEKLYRVARVLEMLRNRMEELEKSSRQSE